MATGLKEAVWAKVAFASVGCSVAGAATNPIDVIKIRLQLQGELRAAASSGEPPVYRGFVRGVWYVARHEGLRGLFKGVLPSVYREASYSGLRLGLYDPIKALYGDTNAPGLSMSLWKKLASGATAGAIAGAITNPLDLVKVWLVVARVFLLLASRDARAHRSLTTPSRAGAHAGSRRAGAVPLGLARRARDRAHSGLHWPVPRTLALWLPTQPSLQYSSLSLSLSCVVSLGLAQGIGPNVQRAMLVGLSQPPSYDEAKHRLIAWHVGDDRSLLVHSLCVPPPSVGASRCSLLTLQ